MAGKTPPSGFRSFLRRRLRPLQRSLHQSLSLPGAWTIARLLLMPASRRRELVTPHFYAGCVSSIDFAAMRRAGCRAVVLDKDNTITPPLSREPPSPPMRDAIRRAQEAFGYENVVVLSNSVGLESFPGYDASETAGEAAEVYETQDGTAMETEGANESRARNSPTSSSYSSSSSSPSSDGVLEAEQRLGLRVLRHAFRKPAGEPGALEESLGTGVRAEEMLVVGDRVMTDIVFGRRQGCATVLVPPLDGGAGENATVRAARAVENTFFLPQQRRRPRRSIGGDNGGGGDGAEAGSGSPSPTATSATESGSAEAGHGEGGEQLVRGVMREHEFDEDGNLAFSSSPQEPPVSLNASDGGSPDH